VQLDAYHRGVASLLRQLGRAAASCCGHREYALPAGRKPDPTFNMDAFRQTVTAILTGTAPPPQLIPAVEPGAKSRPTLRRRDVPAADKPFVEELQRKLGLSSVDGIFGGAQRRLSERLSGIVAWYPTESPVRNRGRSST